ncbi:D-alanyl-lipoteichoic acid biosynthesis protein DltB [Collinsella sp. AGMB00827]|uniref:D-alanyl-lipoteichoic acid biosynthesis protein DltB n=1 Tax=Collinsella ureilytica TaxID=2869515 RepID=A0ABS7MLA6_9ACTN|nr:D-alanyl-lipoteichoic acid biosynthesis protein DltB [Collinsella urealyticum]MBY4798150.1 D-alanyl-lipoteichoic acid biosynthesis protein DltB [Collinsella urealyticum]
MGFYTAPSFFLALAIIIVGAAILGLAQKSLKVYRVVASLVMLACLYSSSLQALGAFCLFLMISCACFIVVRSSWVHGKKSLALYRVCLAATIAPLVIYKISVVTGPGILGFIGISYLTFRAVQALIEIRDGLITEEFDLVSYLSYMIFFPTITSGPIDRSRRFFEDDQARTSRRDYLDLLTKGILLLLIGAVMQLVIATVLTNLNRVAPDAGLPNMGTFDLPHGLRGILRAYVYALYLFFDFAGYSYMAMGASYCLGIRTPQNFRAPFIAVDIKDFWNRWHITLSTWLRDFVFMRFVRFSTKRHLFKSRLACACSGYVVNMTLMGAWHGLTLSYLAYGIYHGILLAVCEIYQKRSQFHKRHRRKRWYTVLSWFITLNLVVFGFALFSGQVQTIMVNLMKGAVHG